jgi:hypothetical protein
MRGGARRRFVTAAEAPVWCRSGRWGPRRVRVTECWAMLTAEHVYTALLANSPERMRPDRCGSATWTRDGRTLSVDFEVRANAVWRFGRVFFRCARCRRLATRMYVPTADSWPACRRCWGLTYESRQRGNYKDTGSLPALGFTARSVAESQTLHERDRRAQEAVKRYAERRAILRGFGQRKRQPSRASDET